MNDAAPIATALWNGNAVDSMQDTRRIQRCWVTERQHLFSSGEAELDSIRFLNAIKPSVTSLTNSSLKLFTEDFEDLKYFDSRWGFQGPTQATGILGLNSSITLLLGDTIKITPTKTLTCVNGAPAAPGEFDVGYIFTPIPISTLIQNLINAINDPLFNSQVVAVLSPSNPLNVNLTLQSPVGVAANSIVISYTITTPGALTATGFNFGADGYGECYLDRQLPGIQSPVIPPDVNLNPYQYSFRRRYRSRAESLPPSVGAQTSFLVEIHGENKAYPGSIRMRGSKYTNPQVWEAWQIATVVAAGEKGLYRVTFSQPVHKLQVEYYGRARGLSVYLARP
jgi:hypothetical protein